MNVRTFFEHDVFHTKWFWIGIAFVMLAAAAVLRVFLMTSRPRTGREFGLLLGLASVVVFWFRSMEDYNVIQSLDLDWSNIDPGSPLYAALDACAGQVARSCYAYAGIAVIMIAGAA